MMDRKYRQGVKGCNCILCGAERSGTGDSAGSVVALLSFLFVLFIVGSLVVWLITT